MKHTLRIHASTETTDQPLPDVALPRLRDATDNIDFSVDIEAHIVPERDRMGQPRHERIVAQFTFTPNTRFSVPVDDLTENEVRQYLGWTSGTYSDYNAPLPDGCEYWIECEEDPPEKQLSERPLPDTVSFDYYDDSESISEYGISVEDYYNTSKLVDVTVDKVKTLANTHVLHDVPWYVIYHKNDVNGWVELIRTGDVPAVL